MLTPTVRGLGSCPGTPLPSPRVGCRWSFRDLQRGCRTPRWSVRCPIATADAGREGPEKADQRGPAESRRPRVEDGSESIFVHHDGLSQVFELEPGTARAFVSRAPSIRSETRRAFSARSFGISIAVPTHASAGPGEKEEQRPPRERSRRLRCSLCFFGRPRDASPARVRFVGVRYSRARAARASGSSKRSRASSAQLPIWASVMRRRRSIFATAVTASGAMYPWWARIIAVWR